jgi:hypothetical protein
VGWNFFGVVTNQDQCRAAALCAQAIDVVDQVLASPGVEGGATRRCCAGRRLLE